MQTTRINWPLVRFKMEERGIVGWSALARVANVHRNTLGRKGPFASTTIDHLGEYFGCDPRELITLEDEPDEAPVTSKTMPIAASTAIPRPRPRLPMPAPGEISQAEAERRAALLAQATGRGKSAAGDGERP